MTAREARSASRSADVEAAYAAIQALQVSAQASAPKDHPWGAKSFLLTDPDGNRWEIAQSPSADGMLSNR